MGLKPGWPRLQGALDLPEVTAPCTVPESSQRRAFSWKKFSMAFLTPTVWRGHFTKQMPGCPTTSHLSLRHFTAAICLGRRDPPLPRSMWLQSLREDSLSSRWWWVFFTPGCMEVGDPGTDHPRHQIVQNHGIESDDIFPPLTKQNDYVTTPSQATGSVVFSCSEDPNVTCRQETTLLFSLSNQCHVYKKFKLMITVWWKEYESCCYSAALLHYVSEEPWIYYFCQLSHSWFWVIDRA